jgi:hypothetical protein
MPTSGPCHSERGFSFAISEAQPQSKNPYPTHWPLSSQPCQPQKTANEIAVASCPGPRASVYSPISMPLINQDMP